jgi:preprotein translocase subunit SecD
MRRTSRLINTYLAALLLTGLAGCTSDDDPEKKKKLEASTMRFHLEGAPTPDGRTVTVQAPIYRAQPYLVSVREQPFLDEGDIAHASVEEEQGGFVIRVQFNDHGKLLLQGVTAGNRGRRIAVFSSWTEARWLAAPAVRKVHEDGVFVFTPDATREEAERITRGINNLIEKLNRKSWVF